MTTKYFKNMSIIGYNFGSNEKPVMFNDLSQYVDVIDGVKDNIAFYNQYTIVSGERPDTLSYKLYGTTDYYWTFFLMNDSLRKQGWPIYAHEILETAQTKYPYRIVTTNTDISNTFPVGQVVTGSQSGTVGRVVKRILDFGQLVIDTSLTPGDYFGKYPNRENFSPTENITYTSEEGAFYNATLIKESEQYNAVHHYEDTNGVWQDLPLYDFGNPSSSWLPITYRDRLNMANEDLKVINVLKPSVIGNVVSEFNNFHKRTR